MSVPDSIPILFLKTPTSHSDAYTTLFGSSTTSSPYTYLPKHVPVLIHSQFLAPLFNLFGDSTSIQYDEASVYEMIDSFPHGGLIFTSARAVDAFAEVLDVVNDGFSSLRLDFRLWRLPFYVVGPATADALRDKVLSRHLRQCEIVGEEAGSGEALAPLIIKDYTSRCGQSSARKPLLFLVGEKHKDIIPRMLRAEGMEVEEMVVYKSVERTIFPYELDIVLRETEHATIRWLVVFSAAGTKAALKSLGWLDEATGRVKEGWDEQERQTFVASIGPTTRDHMRKEFGFEVDVCAQKPSAEGVKEGIEGFMKERGIGIKDNG